MTIESNDFIFNFLRHLKKINVLKGLNPSNEAGTDALSEKLLKDGADILARPIFQVCNLSVKLISFSRSFKVARVKPLFKKGSKSYPQDCCPISPLLLLSKITESIVRDQT